jgi:hypothetical protein
VRIIAEGAAVAAHLDAKRADLVIARGVEQSGHNDQYGSDEVHRRSPRFSSCDPARIFFDRAIDTSGKSGAYAHHAKAVRPAAREIGSGPFAFRH